MEVHSAPSSSTGTLNFSNLLASLADDVSFIDRLDFSIRVVYCVLMLLLFKPDGTTNCCIHIYPLSSQLGLILYMSTLNTYKRRSRFRRVLRVRCQLLSIDHMINLLKQTSSSMFFFFSFLLLSFKIKTTKKYVCNMNQPVGNYVTAVRKKEVELKHAPYSSLIAPLLADFLLLSSHNY